MVPLKSHIPTRPWLLIALAPALAVLLQGAYVQARPQPEKGQPADLERLFRGILDPRAELQKKQKRGVYLERHGAVEKMLISGEWVGRRLDVGIYHRLGFHLADRKDINVYSSFVWRPETEKDSENFLRVLNAPPRALRPDEIRSLRPILDGLIGALPGEFEIRSARTENLNRRRIVAVEGRWMKEGVDSYSVFVDASGCGKLVQQIVYTAPAADYDRYLSDALSAFQSVSWRPKISEFCRAR